MLREHGPATDAAVIGAALAVGAARLGGEEPRQERHGMLHTVIHELGHGSGIQDRQVSWRTLNHRACVGTDDSAHHAVAPDLLAWQPRGTDWNKR